MRLIDDGTLPDGDELRLYPTEVFSAGRPHAIWRVLRGVAPVHHERTPDGDEFWSVTRYNDAVAVLRDNDRFSSAYSTMLSVRGDGDRARGKAIHLMDPPQHTSVRLATRPALSQRALRASEELVRARIAKLVEAAVADGECDLARVLAVLPMYVAGEVLGIPESQWAETAHWTVASMAPDDPAYRDGDPMNTVMQAHVFLLLMFEDIIQRRRREPGDDLVSRLCRTEFDGRPATDEEVLVNCYAFVMGANPTTPQVAAHLANVIAAEPAMWARVREDRDLVPGLVDEALRWASPVNHVLRRATLDVRLGDHDVPAGGLVAVWLASANRDDEIFADPYRFDPTRRPNPHIAFGSGVHRCIGASAATMVLHWLVEAMADRIESITVIDEVRHLASNFLNGVTSLPVRLTPAAHHS